jgi:hypothetical protein
MPPDQALIPVPETSEIEKAGASWHEKAMALVVQDQPSFELAGTMLADVQALRKEIKATFRKPKELAHKAHRAICDAEKTHDAPLSAAEITLKTKASTWAEEESKRRRNEELERQAKARQEEEADRLHQAELLEAAGETEEAQRVIEEEPPPPPPPTRKDVVPKAPTMSVKTTYHAEIVNIRKLCEGIVEGSVPETAVLGNMPVLNAAARAMRKDFTWKGCRLVEKTGIAGRGA